MAIDKKQEIAPYIRRENSKGVTREQPSPRPLTPRDHWAGSLEDNNALNTLEEVSNAAYGYESKLDDSHYTMDKIDHYHWDNRATSGVNTVSIDETGSKHDFFGTTTHVNPNDDPIMNDMEENGLEPASIGIYGENNSHFAVPPLDPIAPSLRIPNATNGNGSAQTSYNPPRFAREANLFSYNRFHHPIADLEFRKGFHHYFISRPECYINYAPGKMAHQTENNSVFASAYERFPYLLDLLSPVYNTTTIEKNHHNQITHNWNFLLCNRILSVEDSLSMSIQDGTGENTKSIIGWTTSLGKCCSDNKSGTISISFRETRYFEVYNCLYLWMWYIDQIYQGLMSPAYDMGNHKGDTDNGQIMPTGAYNIHYKLQSRTLDYCATLFDVFTNESMSRIVHWKKWYGIFPISASVSGYSMENGKPTTSESGMVVTATFAYAAVFSNLYKNLIEFNYNAGFLDHDGTAKEGITLLNSNPFIIRNNSPLNTSYEPATYVNDNYIGAGGAFTGTPYIVLRKDQVLTGAGNYITGKIPYLCFYPLENNDINAVMNNGLHERQGLENVKLVSVD